MRMEYTGYDEFYRKGPFAPYVADRRVLSSVPALMMDIAQPAGDFPDPPVPEMVLINARTQARATCDLGAGRFRCPTGYSAVVPPMVTTAITVDNAHRIRVLAIAPSRLAAWFESGQGGFQSGDLGHLHARGFRNSLIDQLMDRLWEASDDGGDASSLFVDAALLTLWRELLREAQAPRPGPARGGLAPWQARRCTEYLQDHIDENVGLEQLAAIIGLSPFHFARAFRQSTGMPPHRYQLTLRMTQARRMLATTDASVTEIAFAVGYQSSQALARLFRSEMGVSPSDYRRGRL
jgi:AraC family transcriptional regulator